MKENTVVDLFLPYLEIKSRVIAVGKDLKDLMPELKKVGLEFKHQSNLTDYITRAKKGKTASDVLRAIEVIIKKWESEVK